jgi:hypothetical protein
LNAKKRMNMFSCYIYIIWGLYSNYNRYEWKVFTSPSFKGSGKVLCHNNNNNYGDCGDCGDCGSCEYKNL